jgi:uncharacterized protein
LYSLEAAKKFIIYSQTLWLSAERCVYWENKNALILSDAHFGKTGHFRKEGIAVPQNVYQEDLQRLFSLVQFYKPERVIVVGDLFHSSANKELDLFTRWRHDHPALRIDLVMGNHDILLPKWYDAADITVIKGHYSLAPFCFIHDIADECEPSENIEYFFSGHIHPGISFKGLGKQSLSFPCFLFGDNFAVLPAFGKFTGTAKIKPKKSDHVFAILPKQNGQNASIISVTL